MKKLLLILTVALFTVIDAESAQEEARLLRFPSTNGSEIAFSYAGDIWTVPVSGGQARRLTSHIGYEAFARYSPDGKMIAFTAEYDGNREVYVMPSEGGVPRRLTFTSTNSRDDMGDRMGPNNIVMCWTPDGSGIVYRNRIGDGFQGKLWIVPVEGGMPEEIPLPEGGFCSWSPDGKTLAYNRVMREFRTWKYYRGGMADDIWTYDTKAKKVKRVVENNAQDIFPMWIGREIYFASDRDMTMNLFSVDPASGKVTKVTDHSDYDVKFPSTDGKTIVYEQGGWIWRYDPSARKSTKVSITLAAEEVQARPSQVDVSGRITAVSIPSSGKRMAVTARGEVFDVPVGQGVTRNITRTSGANERSADWSPDGKWIAYISDITGETEIWASPSDGGEKVQITKDNDTYIRSLQWTPDGKTILYTDRENRLVAVDFASKSKRVLMQNPEAEFRGVSVSPDSKWLAYTKPSENDMSVAYVYDIASGKEIQVTENLYDSYSPVFSSDGKYLIFGSYRDLRPIYSQVEWNYAYNNMGGVYLAILGKDTPSPMLPSDQEVDSEPEKKADSGKAGDKAGDKGNGKGSEASEVSVKVDADGLMDRIIKLPLSDGSSRNWFCDGKKLWFSSRGSTMVFDFATQKESKVADAGFSATFGSKKAIFYKGNNYYVANFPADRVSLENPVDVSHLTATVDWSEEWAQIFDEVWRAFRDGYYLKNMNGRDWNAVKAKYAPLVPYAKTRLDLNYVIGEMIAEVATGHAYVNPGSYPKPERISMGLLGARLSRDKSGFFRIDEILPGESYRSELRSPLTEPGVGVKEGDYITAIDGVPVNTVMNIYELLRGKAGVLTELTVNTSASKGGKKVVIKPIADEYMLYHNKWVMNNLKTVEEKSGGRVGYIYIPDMGPEGLNEFVRLYYPQLTKEALIIDDRSNGGGNVSPMIIERLQRTAYNMTMRRGSTKVSPVPEGTQTGPKVLLIDKYSASDGDLFPWRFKANKLGTVVGTRTWGGIVGISGPLPYIDGTDVRVPFFTNYDAKTGEWIVENYGVDPDIYIDNDPVAEFSGKDQQLEKAIEVALEQLKDRKPLPGVPAPRTFKDLGLPQPDDTK